MPGAFGTAESAKRGKILYEFPVLFKCPDGAEAPALSRGGWIQRFPKLLKLSYRLGADFARKKLGARNFCLPSGQRRRSQSPARRTRRGRWVCGVDIFRQTEYNMAEEINKPAAPAAGKEKDMDKPTKDPSRILVMLTGGTICSSTNKKGERYSDASHVKIVEKFQKSESPWRQVQMDTSVPMDILSENMTVKTWNVLLNTFRKVDWNAYRGVILLHGTDTLAYTAALLAIVLAGAPIPVCLVSSQLPLSDPQTNGHANFRCAVELIMNGIAPNVYAVYRNSDNVLYVHYGALLLQCANYSDDFFSVDAMAVPDAANACLPGKAFQTRPMPLYRMGPLTDCVLMVTPYVGIRYDRYNLTGVRAVVHGTYHSQTVCVERKGGRGDYSSYSILSFMDRCRDLGVTLLHAPCSPSAYRYESTGDILARGAGYIRGQTNEMAYVKAMVGCALGLKGEALEEFVNRSVNYEQFA